MADHKDQYPLLPKGRALRAPFTFTPDPDPDAPDPGEVVCDLRQIRDAVVVVDGWTDAPLDNAEKIR